MNKGTWKKRIANWVETAIIVLIICWVKDNLKLPTIDWANPATLMILAFLGGILVCVIIGKIIKKIKK